jgi:hypothetical protein
MSHDEVHGEPITVEDVWERVIQLEFELRERHKDFKFAVELGLLLNFLGTMAVVYKLYF